MATEPNETETLVLKALVIALRRKLAMSEDQVFAVIAPAVIDGQPIDVIQVSFGAVNAYGAGEGYQEGGGLQMKGIVVCTWFKRVLMDMHGRVEDILTEASNGLLEQFTKIRRDIFGMTNLGNLLLETIAYVGQSATSWEDAEKGIARRDVNFGVVWAEQRPTTVTLTAEDLA